jgi:hypothetical protein
MPAFAALTVNDGRDLDPTPGTPVPVTFNPSSIDSNGVAKWYESGVDVLDARRSLSQSVKQPVKGSQVARVQLKVVVPVMDETDESLKVGDGLCNVEFVIPKRMSRAQRCDLYAAVRNLLDDETPPALAVLDLESVY